MPKVVDPVERRREIIDAVFRLVVRDGMAAASLRHIADEAGLNIGSVRHYFPDVDALFEAAAREMADRVERRIRAELAALDGALTSDDSAAALAATMHLFEQFLPLDEERRSETIVWLAFMERSRTQPHLRPYATELLEGPRELARLVTRHVGADHDAAEVLAAAVDGLTLAAVHRPEDYPPERQRGVLGRALASTLRA
ncbi:TetR family transcriptional regulator C-terminal domain-containing protein [Mariniluteicoccus endophyticus]